MDVDSDDRGYTFEELDLIEAKMKREEEVEARRLAADDEWSDRVVAEQEQAEARKASEAAKRPAAATASAKEEERCHLAAALAPFGLVMAAVEGAGRGLLTARPFAAGELLLRVAPTAAVVDGASADSRCHECFATPKEGASLQRCSGCRFAAWSKCSFDSAPARLLCLLTARLAALAGWALPGEGPAHWALSYCLGCSSEPPPKSPIPQPFTMQASPATAAYATEGSNPRLADP